MTIFFIVLKQLDLLVHKSKAPSKEPVGYPQPEWWTDMQIDINNPAPQINDYGLNLLPNDIKFI